MANPDLHDSESGVGALLRASRLRCGEELQDVAAVLRIRYPYLEAIEEGRFEDLPGQAYAAGFIRAYAHHLGLDSDEVVRRFKDEASGAAGGSRLEFPSPIPEAGVPGGAILFVGVVVAVLAYGGWYISSSENDFFAEKVSPLPKRLANLISRDANAPKGGAPAPGGPVEPKSAEPSPSAATAAATASGGGGDQGQAAPQSAPPSEPEKTKTESPPEPQQPAPAAPAAPSQPDAREPMASGNDENKPAKVKETASSQQAAETESPPPAAAAPASSPRDSTPAGAAQENPQQPAEALPEAQSAPQSSAGPETANEPASTPAPSNEAARTPEAAAETTSPPEAAAETTSPPGPAREEVSERPADGASQPETTPPPSKPTEQVASVPEPVAPAESTASAVGGGTVYGAVTGKSRILVHAKTNSWIQVRDEAQNKLLVTRLLRAGDSYRVPDRTGLKLSAGNAGALEITVDGKAVPPIGPLGAVRRSVALDVEQLRAGTAAQE